MLVRNLQIARTLRYLWPFIIGYGAWSSLVVMLHTLSHHPEQWGLSSSSLANASDVLGWSSVGVPFGAIAALGSALAIFLGFRNNSSYDRWWEARKIWGALVNDSRSWCRQVLAWVEAPKAADPAESEAAIAALRVELVHRHLAFVHGLVHHLRKQPELSSAVARFVPAEEAARYAEVPNVPTALLIEQGKRVAWARSEGQIEHFRHLVMDELLTRFSDIQGKCERIKNTPLPRQYDAFPRWFAYFYGAIFPLGVVEVLGWAAVPLSTLVTLLFLSLEVSGRIIENPFEGQAMDTPMSALAVTIERDLRAALGEPLPDPVEPDAFGALM